MFGHVFEQTPTELASKLVRWTRAADLTRYPKTSRGSKKPKPKPAHA
jgi:hypothetical protein